MFVVEFIWLRVLLFECDFDSSVLSILPSLALRMCDFMKTLFESNQFITFYVYSVSVAGEEEVAWILVKNY